LLARNCKILPFEFSKFVKDIKGRFDDLRLFLFESVEINCTIAKLTVWQELSTFGLKPRYLGPDYCTWRISACAEISACLAWKKNPM